ncbi:hypothetical protein [Synechococcus sp. WH 7805]|uniref:hypothetical protein n=1 Tax=unclassified Synechococcus TaxID=2626047 RepID=UPI0002E3F0DA|nr:hypothetical protein [Synechococcus sp. WH 7805]
MSSLAKCGFCFDSVSSAFVGASGTEEELAEDWFVVHPQTPSMIKIAARKLKRRRLPIIKKGVF